MTYVGPPWAARAIALWLEGERLNDIAGACGVSHQRIGQVLAANGPPARLWVTMPALAEFASLDMIRRWADAGQVRRHPRSRLVHQMDVLDLFIQLMERPCRECGQPILELWDNLQLCAACRPVRAANHTRNGQQIAERIYEAHPKLRDELDEMERQLDAGELETVDHEEVRRRLQQLIGGEAPVDPPPPGLTTASGDAEQGE